jgi:hypothetical protein
MAKKPKTSALKHHLPDRKHAPKKTGKSGVRPPLDPVADFDTPTRTAESQLEELDKPATKKGSLLAEQPPKPKVVGDRMEVFYLKPIFGKTPKGDITVAMAITVPLEDGHLELLPKIIADGYKDVTKKGRKSMNFRELPGQHAQFFLSHDSAEAALELPAAKMINAGLAIVERKGEGSARQVIRLSFRLQVKLAREVTNFAEHNLQNTFWLKLEETQEELFDEGDED